MSSWSRISAALAIAVGATLVLAGSAAAVTFANTTPIAINDGGGCAVNFDALAPGAALPYPSQITVSGVVGSVTDVNVGLNTLTHSFLDDVGVLLVGPTGLKTYLLVDAGGGVSVSGVNLIFNDVAVASVPDDSAPASGSYKPTVGTTGTGDGCRMSTVAFPSPAPAGPHASALSVFNGSNPNGTWSLYVVDDTGQLDTGFIGGGWSLEITAQALAVTMAGISARPARDGVLVRWRTASEVDFLGFHVYRARGQSWRRLTRSLIVTRGGVAGASYRFLDRRARRGAAYRYRIQAVNLDGSRQWFGPVRVRVPG